MVAPEGYWTMNVGSLSTEEWAQQQISSAYPNPATERVNFNLNNIGGPMQVSIYNVLGQQLMTRSIENANGVITLELNPEWQGTLFVQFEGNFGQVNKRIIKM